MLVWKDSFLVIRSGSVLRVSLAQAGATVVDMQVAGRWKSSQMSAYYARAEMVERCAIVRYKETNCSPV